VKTGWATQFFSEYRRDFLILGTVKLSDKEFFNHMARYGLVRRVGSIDGWLDLFGGGGDAVETPKPVLVGERNED
jgi:hypothetical protein